jgi:dihydroorotase
MIGLEPALSVMLGLIRDNVFTAQRLIETLSSAPAKVARLDVGTLREGALADIAVIDPDVAFTLDASGLSSRSSNTPFLGMQLRGRVVMTLVGGHIVHEVPSAP